MIRRIYKVLACAISLPIVGYYYAQLMIKIGITDLKYITSDIAVAIAGLLGMFMTLVIFVLASFMIYHIIIEPLRDYIVGDQKQGQEKPW